MKNKKQIKNTDNEWQNTFDSIMDMIFILDKDHTILRVNKIFLEVLKLKADQVIGKKCYELLHKSNRPWKLCPHVKTVLDGKAYTEEVDDPVLGIPFLVSTSPIFDNKGECIGSVHIAKDITERKKMDYALKKYANDLEKLNNKLREKMNDLQEKDQRLYDASLELEARKELIQSEKARLEIILGQMGEGLIVINEKNGIDLINNQAVKILGYERSSDIPEGYKKFFILQLWKEIHESNAGIVRKELILQRPREAVLLVTLAPLRVGNEKQGFVAVLREITVEKKSRR